MITFSVWVISEIIPSTVMKVAQRTSDIRGYSKDYTTMWSYYEYENVEHLVDQPNIEEINLPLIALRSVQLLFLLYIELTISFLIGRKRTVNFRNPRL